MMDQPVSGPRDGERAMDARIARQHLRMVAEESGLTFDELLRLWWDDTSAQLANARAALAAGDLAEAARLVHGAAGASGICGVSALSDELRRVEALAVAGRGLDARAGLEHAALSFARLSGELHESQS